MNKQPDHIDEALLLRYSLDQVDEADKLLVEEWLQREDNQAVYENWLRIWQTAKAVEKFDVIDVDDNWAQIQPKLKAGGQKKNIWLKIAAVLLLVATLTFVFEAYFRSSHTEMIIYTALADEKIVLPDNSEVWLKQGSSLEYPEKFTGITRKVSLKGEALFDIQHNADQAFIVEAGNSTTKVLGTQFNLRTADDNGNLELVLLEGKVQFSTLEEQVILSPGQKVSVGADGYLTKDENSNPNFLSWRTGNFVFINTPMEQVLIDLANAYGFSYQFADAGFKSCPLTSKYQQESLEDIFRVLEVLFDAQFNYSNNQLEIIGGQCK